MWLKLAIRLNKVLYWYVDYQFCMILFPVYMRLLYLISSIFLLILSFPDLETKASGLSTMSKKYHKDAQYLNMRSTVAKIAAGAVVTLVFLLYFFVF